MLLDSYYFFFFLDRFVINTFETEIDMLEVYFFLKSTILSLWPWRAASDRSIHHLCMKERFHRRFFAANVWLAYKHP